jgi:hypothetical protein
MPATVTTNVTTLYGAFDQNAKTQNGCVFLKGATGATKMAGVVTTTFGGQINFVTIAIQTGFV